VSTHDTAGASEADAQRRSPAEETRTLVSSQTVGHLATIDDAGHPWCSLAAYGPMADGTP